MSQAAVPVLDSNAANTLLGAIILQIQQQGGQLPQLPIQIPSTPIATTKKRARSSKTAAAVATPSPRETSDTAGNQTDSSSVASWTTREIEILLDKL